MDTSWKSQRATDQEDLEDLILNALDDAADLDMSWRAYARAIAKVLVQSGTVTFPERTAG